MPRNTSPVPHSWSVATWPREVWPHDSHRARYVVRANRDDLIAAGVLTRVGRELVILGDRYGRWLQRKSADVPGYEVAANRTRGRVGGDQPGESS